MVLTPEERAANKRNKMIQKTREMSGSKYISKFVAPIFQKMIRAEAAAKPACNELVVFKGKLDWIGREVGQCVCVTCGKVQPWSGGCGGMNAGHFLASRRNSILFEELNVWPQCTRCNTYEGGNPQAYRLWMEEVHGQDVIDRLRKLKETSIMFTGDELVDMRIAYQARLDAAIVSMRNQ